MVGFFNVLSAAAFILCLVELYCVARIATAVRELQRLRQLCSASRIESLETSLNETQEVLSELANKVKMQRVRTAVHHTKDSQPNSSPDPYTNPDEWRRQMNRQLALPVRKQ